MTPLCDSPPVLSFLFAMLSLRLLICHVLCPRFLCYKAWVMSVSLCLPWSHVPVFPLFSYRGLCLCVSVVLPVLRWRYVLCQYIHFRVLPVLWCIIVLSCVPLVLPRSSLPSVYLCQSLHLFHVASSQSVVCVSLWFPCVSSFGSSLFGFVLHRPLPLITFWSGETKR